MSIKRKISMGAMSALLGMSLVGGGTWAAFNDTATINNHFAAGTLDLVVGKSHNKPISFDLGNMKPGDNVQRIFELRNAGTLAIKEVLLDVDFDNFVDDLTAVNGGENTAVEFLSQFKVNFLAVDTESPRWEPRGKVVLDGKTLTLADLVAGPSAYGTKVDPRYLSNGVINLVPLVVATDGDQTRRGLPVNPTDIDNVFIEIEFINNTEDRNADGTFVQNKFQGDSIDFFFNLEATQWDGVHVDSNHRNGDINNGVQGSADGNSMPNQRTIQRNAEGTLAHDEEVTD
ncbi:spore coat protein [Anaerobacillus alkaliphilus]|uniref:Spore coat protein n=1 Tax=Anaerobacillus alkaliphilus TaxID=1548597 RepID=A0A4Q0VTX5_9BACI|nr:TasA family protein [Anaerobacillus alkaliphilus]RXJ01758.1 spore coat protein [Anaerobacillus alkaliphilus]